MPCCSNVRRGASDLDVISGAHSTEFPTTVSGVVLNPMIQGQGQVDSEVGRANCPVIKPPLGPNSSVCSPLDGEFSYWKHFRSVLMDVAVFSCRRTQLRLRFTDQDIHGHVLECRDTSRFCKDMDTSQGVPGDRSRVARLLSNVPGVGPVSEVTEHLSVGPQPSQRNCLLLGFLEVSVECRSKEAGNITE